MESFLRSLAKAYITRYEGDLCDVCFVFPGKRAGAFFLRHVKECTVAKTAILPAVTSISDFVEQLSGKVVDSRIDQICLLFDIYRRIKRNQQAKPVTFDKFQSWADTMLADFNDVEMYRVNPEALFRNVRQLKNIRSNYLTDEQMKVLKQYFGFSDFYNASDRHLWRHYDGNGPMTKRFLTLFDYMGDLYTEFCAALDKRGLTFSGRAYSQALDALAGNPADVLPYRRVVLAGFNALTTVEFLIFKTLGKANITLDDGSSQPLADFYWDCTGVPLGFDDNIGRHFIENNRRNFPSLYDLSESDCPSLPQKIVAIASPSGVAQAKISGVLLDDILKRKKAEEHSGTDAADVAVVLPDENLLLPVLYSLPAHLREVNLTMGYPFSMTTVANFVKLLETYQLNLRLKNRIWTARASDADALLSNPLASLLLGEEICSSLSATITDRRRLTVPVDILTAHDGMCRLLFMPLGTHATSDIALRWLMDILTALDGAMDGGSGQDLRLRRLDHSHVLLYADAVRRLSDAFKRYGIAAGARATFRLTSGLLAGEMVRFEGKPLVGVQVMGPLETRSLDFRYLIIPSMNERIYPRRLHQRSFIPAVVRRGFGMATTRFQEAIFTYYFYRMISRAKEVYLIYDSRTEGLHSGSPSRFILQLKHLYAKGHVDFRRYRFDIDARHRMPVNVSKTPEILSMIEDYFTPGSGKALSASSLNNLISCPLRFYLQNLRMVNKEHKTLDGLQGNDLGSIVHAALESVYKDLPDRIVPAMLLKSASDNRFMRETVTAAINREYYRNMDNPQQAPDDDIALFLPNIEEMVRNVMLYDTSIAPFTFISAEKRESLTLTLPGGTTVNFLYIIDRVDCTDPADPHTPLRIVDYKTGTFNVETESIEQLFESDHADTLVQLLLYSYLYGVSTGTTRPLSPVIYNVPKMYDAHSPDALARPKIGKTTLTDVTGVMTPFLEMLEKTLTALRDPDTPLRQAPDGARTCAYCPFAKAVCGITIKKDRSYNN